MKMLSIVLYAIAVWLAVLAVVLIAGAPLAPVLALSPMGVSAFVVALAAVDLLFGDSAS